MKRRRSDHPAPSTPEKTTVRTGEHCPDSGWWYPAPPEFPVAQADGYGS